RAPGPDLVVAREERVVLVRKTDGERDGARPGGAAQDQRRARTLDGPRQRGAVLELVLAALEADVALRPEPVHDLDLFGEHLHPHAQLRKRKAVGRRLALVPAGA